MITSPAAAELTFARTWLLLSISIRLLRGALRPVTKHPIVPAVIRTWPTDTPARRLAQTEAVWLGLDDPHPHDLDRHVGCKGLRGYACCLRGHIVHLLVRCRFGHVNDETG